jgi:hypothetical protein
VEILRCELVAEGSGCRLIFTHTFDDPSCGARNAVGWEMCFENLDLVLKAAAIVEFSAEVWETKFKLYVERYEPQVGPQQGMPEGTRN